ncbi:MAG TPA: AMP-binding protein [Acidimicrobiales bacterium]|nr:AMP-binding protein [Acidimicrobiales bacterium]
MNVAGIIDGHPDDAVALVVGDRTVSYGELRREVAGLQGGLTELGLDVGDRVGLMAGNTVEFVLTWLAAARGGFVAVPLNPGSPGPELARELVAVGARAVVCGPEGSTVVADLDRAALPVLEHVIVGDDLADLVAHAPAETVEREAADLAVLMFTSGTAGAPRAAMLTHGNLVANLEQVQASEGRRRGPDDVALGVIPLFHIFGLNVVLGGGLVAGSRIVLLDRFDAEEALRAIVAHGVTDLTGPPAMWHGLAAAESASPDAVATVERAASGAAALGPEIRKSVQERLGLALAEGYGLTETSPVVATGVGQDAPVGSVGRPLPGVEVRIIDADGEDTFIGDAGEILVRGDNVFVGYWNDPEATTAVLTGDGWLHTGDIGFADESGFLFLSDRAKDLIIVSGFNVFPAEVEDVLVSHPDVAEAAVVGVPNARTGEAVKAFVVLEEGAGIGLEDLREHTHGHLARYKCPAEIELVDELPHGPSGKLLRRTLRG